MASSAATLYKNSINNVSNDLKAYLLQADAANEQTMQFNSAEAEKNRTWQAEQSSTAHQREVADLAAAGLNPVLSSNAGAVTGSGSSASVDNALTNAYAGVAETALQISSNLSSAAAANATSELNTRRTNRTNLKISKRSNKTERYKANVSAKTEKYKAQVQANATVTAASISAEASRYVANLNYKAQVRVQKLKNKFSQWQTNANNKNAKDVAKIYANVNKYSSDLIYAGTKLSAGTSSFNVALSGFVGAVTGILSSKSAKSFAKKLATKFGKVKAGGFAVDIGWVNGNILFQAYKNKDKSKLDRDVYNKYKSWSWYNNSTFKKLKKEYDAEDHSGGGAR